MRCTQYLCLIVIITTFLSSCAKSPLGRNQLKLYSSSQLAGMGEQAFSGMKTQQKVSNQLAAVIGHEVGHVIAEHGNERMSSSALIGVGMEVTNQLLKANEIASSNMIMAGLGLGVQVGVQLPFGRTHESEADLIGLDLMAKAGINPQQSINLWQNMDKAAGKNRQPEFLSTHPLPSTRIKNLTNNMPSALKSYRLATNKPNCKI